EAKVIIPDEAIRIRIVPNSNSIIDQNIKTKVKTNLQNDMYDIVKNTHNINKARQLINNNLNKIDKNINNILIKENYKLGYKINFGYNYFPAKEFRGVTYNEGYYESVVVTIGQGNGNNWWCVMFPPLCLMEAEENENIKYASFVQEIISKYK
ncbi:MAG: stage II sporulation protein R, partial [Bacilli bacterium]